MNVIQSNPEPREILNRTKEIRETKRTPESQFVTIIRREKTRTILQWRPQPPPQPPSSSTASPLLLRLLIIVALLFLLNLNLNLKNVDTSLQELVHRRNRNHEETS